MNNIKLIAKVYEELHNFEDTQTFILEQTGYKITPVEFDKAVEYSFDNMIVEPIVKRKRRKKSEMIMVKAEKLEKKEKKQKEPFSARITKEAKDALIDLANKNKTSRALMLQQILEDYFDL